MIDIKQYRTELETSKQAVGQRLQRLYQVLAQTQQHIQDSMLELSNIEGRLEAVNYLNGKLGDTDAQQISEAGQVDGSSSA